MVFKMRRLNIAMLGDQAQASQVEPQTELDVVGQQVEDDLLEANEKAQYVSQIVQATDDAVTAADDLDGELQAVSQLPANENQRTVAVESIRRNVLRILSDIGLRSTMPALESRTISVESVGQTIKDAIVKIWKMITDAWKAMVAKLKEFFTNIFDASKRLKKRAEALKNEAGKLKQDYLIVRKADAKSVGYTAPNSVKEYLRGDNKPMAAEKAVIGLKKHSDIINDIVKEVSSPEAFTRYKDVIEQITKMAVGIKDADEMNEDAVSALIKSAVAPIREIFDPGEYRKWFSDKYIVLSSDKTFGVVDADNRKDLTEEHDPLFITEIKSLCDLTIDQMGEYEKSGNLIKELEKFTSKIESESKSAVSGPDSGGDWALRKSKSQYIAQVIRLIMGAVTSAAIQVRRLDLNLYKAAIDWAASSFALQAKLAKDSSGQGGGELLKTVWKESPTLAIAG